MIRRLTPPDLDAVQRILAQSPEAAQWPLSSLAPDRDTAGNIILLVSDQAGTIAGFAAFRAVADEAEILNLAVAPAWRRRSVGTELVDAICEQSITTGAKRIFLEVRESNAAARAFYARMKFAQLGTRRSFYRDPTEDAVLMSRVI